MPPANVPEQLPKVVVVTGPEELLVDRAIGDIVRRARAANAAEGGADSEADIRDLSAPGLEAGTVTELSNPSLFGERKVIIVRDVQDADDALVEELKGYVAAPPDDVTLVLAHRGGQRGTGVIKKAAEHGAPRISCEAVKTRRDKSAFVRGEFAARRRKATTGAVDRLLDAISGGLRELASAADQLCADTTGTISEEVVTTYYAGHAEVLGFTVADRAVEGHADEALRQLRLSLQTGTDPVPIVAAIASSLRAIVKLASAPRGLKEVDLAREVGVPPWKLRVIREQMRGWDAERITVAIAAVADADLAVKGGAGHAEYALEKAVMAVATARGRN